MNKKDFFNSLLEIKEMEFDEMWHCIGSKKRKLWLIKAFDRGTRRTVAWVLGNRDSATLKPLYDKVSHLKDCRFYADAWQAFAEVLPSDRLNIGKKHTVGIERDNRNTRHHLARSTRRTKVVSKSVNAVDTSVRPWQALATPVHFQQLQEIALSIYR